MSRTIRRFRLAARGRLLDVGGLGVGEFKLVWIVRVTVLFKNKLLVLVTGSLLLHLRRGCSNQLGSGRASVLALRALRSGDLLLPNVGLLEKLRHSLRKQRERRAL
jgi:hypothetical protein